MRGLLYLNLPSLRYIKILKSKKTPPHDRGREQGQLNAYILLSQKLTIITSRVCDNF